MTQAHQLYVGVVCNAYVPTVTTLGTGTVVRTADDTVRTYNNTSACVLLQVAYR
jgi:hypothetical protein